MQDYRYDQGVKFSFPLNRRVFSAFAHGTNQLMGPRLRRAQFTRHARAYRKGSRTSARLANMKHKRRVRTKKRPSSGRGVTFEHDRQGIYRRKSMPKGKRKGWKRFTRKVHAVAEKELGSRTVVFNHSVIDTQNTAGKQGQTSLCLYGLQSSAAWRNDLTVIETLENQGNSTAAAGETVDSTSKYMFQSGVLDLTIRNVSFLGNDATALDPDATLELDIYDIISPRRWTDADGSKNSVQELFTQASGDTKLTGGTGFGIDIDDRGVTPWDITQALSRWRIKILKKTKYFLRNGQTCTYQLRDPKRHVISGQSMADGVGANQPGMTRWILIIHKTVPGITVGTAAGETTMSIYIGATRKYLYKVEGLSAARDRYIT